MSKSGKFSCNIKYNIKIKFVIQAVVHFFLQYFKKKFVMHRIIDIICLINIS